MNKTMINVLLFFTLVMGTMAILTFDVWADSSTDDVYEIPEDYNSRNYVVQYRINSTGTMYVDEDDGTQSKDTYSAIIDYNYDFTVFFPKDFLCSLIVTSGSYQRNAFSFWFFNEDFCQYVLNSSLGNLSFDINNVSKVDLISSDTNEKVSIYIKKESISYHKVLKPAEHDIQITDKLTTLSSMSNNYTMSDLSLFSVNYPFVFRPYSGYDKLIYSGIYGSNYLVQQIPSSFSNDQSTNVSALKAVERRISNNVSGVFPEPLLNQVKKISNDTLHCFYSYPTQGRTPNFNYIYPKIYVKLEGEDWVEYKETDTSKKGFEHVFILHVDNQNQSIWGALSLRTLYVRMGYTYSEITADDFVPPKIQGIIWGVQYGYALTQNILDESSIRKSKIVFSRYVFEDNIVDTPDVGIGDLGDLPNISGSNSSIEVGSGNSSGSGSNIGSSGGHDVPAPSDSADYSDVGSFFKSLNFDFSSIGKALSGSFSLVTGFASMIGTIFQNFFGEAVRIIALLAIGICIVLRVLGR